MTTSTRLTTGIRECICNRIIQHRWKSEGDTLVRARADLAQTVYEYWFSAEIRTQMDALPEGWLPKLICFDANVGGYRVDMRFDGHFFGRRSFSEVLCIPARRTTYDFYRGSSTVPVPNDHTLGVAIRSHLDRVSEYISSIKNDEDKIKAILGTFNTTKKLTDAWPEIKPFISQKSVPEQSTALAIDYTSLNMALKLPVNAQGGDHDQRA